MRRKYTTRTTGGSDVRGRISALGIVLVLLAGALSLGGSASAREPKPYATTTGKSQPIYDESVFEEYRVDTKWGEIYGIVERPVVPDGVKVPVILTYTPYSLLTNPLSPVYNGNFSYDDADYFVPRGYARAFFDLVGTGQSSGCYDHGGIRERKTGAAVIDFLGTRSWSNGKVGMIGASYDGTTQWAAAVEQPKHLTTMIPQVAIDRWYDYAFSQGVRYASGSGTPYLFDYGFGVVPTHPTVPTPDTVVDHARPCERLEHNERAFLPDPVYDSFWDERDYLRRVHKIQASVMIEGSWVDRNVHPRNSIYMWNALPADHPKKLVMSQQGHGGADLEDTLNIRHAWFDYWLLGLDTGVMDLPPVDSRVNTGLRIQDPSWPPPGTKQRTLRLVQDASDDAQLDLVETEPPIWIDDDPTLDHGLAMANGGGDSDLIFLGEPFRKRARIAGIPKLSLQVVTDIENTWLTPVLFDEGPDGSRSLITTGLMNARNRFGLRRSEPLVPGEPWRGTVEFEPTDWIVKKGHRIGVVVMSMNAAEALYWSGFTATNELLLNRPNKLRLPLAPAPRL